MEDALAGWRTRKKERQESLRGNLNPGGSGGAARSGARQEKKQSAKGLTCHKCGEIGHIQRNCHKGSSPGSAQSADGDSVRGGRQSERGRGKGRGRGSHGRGGRGGNQAAAGGGASAVALSLIHI